METGTYTFFWTPLLFLEEPIYSASDWLAFCFFSTKKSHPLPSDESTDSFVVIALCAKYKHLVIRLEKGSSAAALPAALRSSSGGGVTPRGAAGG